MMSQEPLSLFGSGRASEVVAANPEINQWVIGGHSLGGVMAARYASQNPDKVEGLALWAAYPAADNDLRKSGITVTSIYATLDGLTTLEDIEASRNLLPLDTLWVEIEGGNHAQFGDYGAQSGDREARIPLAEQEKMVI
jgi:dienelactone hydrolase